MMLRQKFGCSPLDSYFCELCGEKCIRTAVCNRVNPLSGNKIFRVVYKCPKYHSVFNLFSTGHSSFAGYYVSGEFFHPFEYEDIQL